GSASAGEVGAEVGEAGAEGGAVHEGLQRALVLDAGEPIADGRRQRPKARGEDAKAVHDLQTRATSCNRRDAALQVFAWISWRSGIFVSSSSMPRPGEVGSVTEPFCGMIRSRRKNWWIWFHLTRYSSSGQRFGGCEAIRWTLAGTEWPWGITGT